MENNPSFLIEGENMIFKKPELEDKKEFLNYVIEAFSNDEPEIPLSYDGHFEKWIEEVENERLGISLKEGRVPSTTLFAIVDNEIVGTLSIRHNLNTPYVLNFVGHIGYNVRCSKRNRGYAKMMLRKGLEECKKMQIKEVLITCLESNIASRKVIESQGGIYQNKIYYMPSDEYILRFIIQNSD